MVASLAFELTNLRCVSSSFHTWMGTGVKNRLLIDLMKDLLCSFVRRVYVLYPDRQSQALVPLRVGIFL